MSCPNSRASGSSARLAAALVAVLVLTLAAAPAFADRLTINPRLSVAQEYQTNATNAEESRPKQDDFVLKLSPSAEIEIREEQGRARVKFGVNSRRYATLDDLDADDPFARFDFDYRATPRLSFFGDGRWTDQANRDPVENGDVILQGGRADLERWHAGVGFNYSLGARSTTRLSFRRTDNDYTVTEFSRPQRDSTTDTLEWSYRRLLSMRDSLVARLMQSATRFDAIEAQDLSAAGDQADDMTAFTLGWNHRLSQRWTASLSGGLRYLTSQGTQTIPGGFIFLSPILAISAPTLRLDTDDSSTSFIGDLRLTRSTELGSFQLSISQTTRPSGQRTGSLDVTTLTAALRRRLTERLTLNASGSYSRQQSASQFQATLSADDLAPALEQARRFGFDATQQQVCQQGYRGTFHGGSCELSGQRSAFDSDILSLGISLDWRMRRHLTAFLGYEFHESQSKVSLLGADSHRLVNQRVRVGFRYAYGQKLF